ncbi:MAG: putative molybdenum carrier protein [Bacteroidota bacterium]
MTIVAGGQTGVDRAALDAARSLGLDVAGWCPRGRRAEDGPIPMHYPLRETSTAFYIHRTRLNVRDSDATLMLVLGRIHGGTALTADFARRMAKPCHVVNLLTTPQPDAATRAWLNTHRPLRLNIAGPRASQGDAVYARGFEYCSCLLAALVYSG